METWNLWREENPQIDPDLSAVDLRWALLVRFNLSDVDFRDANLDNANLQEANLQAANFGLPPPDFHITSLKGADLSRANLINANFVNASLNNANLSGANLHMANFNGAELTNANLTEASIDRADFTSAQIKGTNFRHTRTVGTRFTDVDLSVAKGLDKVWHYGPSSIDIESIYLSKGNIPDVFLRGCGIPENFITHMRSLVEGAQPIQFYSCFISYSHTDKALRADAGGRELPPQSRL